MSRSVSIAIAALSAVLLTAADQSRDWGDDPSHVAGDRKEFAETQAICRSVKTLTIPAADLPDAKTQAALKGCSSEDLYYGVGMPKNLTKARQCAIMEWQADPGRSDPFFGAGMLMTIYANGAGGRRDYDLATHMACNTWAAPVDSDTLVRAVQAHKSGAEKSEFDYCGDVMQGYSNNSAAQCLDHEEHMAKPKRAAKLKPLLAGWTPAQAAAYRDFKAAQANFILARQQKERGAGVVNRSAPVAHEAWLLDAEVDLIGRLSRGAGPKATPAQRQAEDRRLQASYQAAMRDLPTEGGFDYTITRDGLRDTERAWIAYRDAWLRLAAARWPAASQNGLAAHLTRARWTDIRCDVQEMGESGEAEKECSERG